MIKKGIIPLNKYPSVRSIVPQYSPLMELKMFGKTKVNKVEGGTEFLVAASYVNSGRELSWASWIEGIT
jgi:hypothetical protein